MRPNAAGRLRHLTVTAVVLLLASASRASAQDEGLDLLFEKSSPAETSSPRKPAKAEPQETQASPKQSTVVEEKAPDNPPQEKQTTSPPPPNEPQKESPRQPAFHRDARLEEIIVTARRREESLQDVPVAVTAVTPELMTDNALHNMGDLGRITPSLNFSQSPGQGINPVVALRGQLQNDPTALALDPSVGIYLDEVYLGRAQGSLLDFFDIQRVEILKGPQGTLYGRNTTGGAIKLIPAKADPGGGWSGFARGELGAFGSKEIEGAVNVPVLRDLAFRLSYSDRSRDGWGKQLVTNPNAPSTIIGHRDINNLTSHAPRLNGIWNVTDNFHLEWGADYTDISTNGASNYDAAGDLPQTAPGTGNVTGFTRSSKDFYTYASDFPTAANALTKGVYLKGTYDFWGITAKVIQAHRWLDYFTNVDADGTGARGIFFTSDQGVDQDSTELQLLGELLDRRLSYTAGFFHFIEKGRDSTRIFASELAAAALGVPLPIGPGSPPGSIPLSDVLSLSHVQNQSLSPFLQTTVHVTDSIGLTAGVRYIHESKGLRRSAFERGIANNVPGEGFGSSPGGTPGCIFDPSAKGVTNNGTDCLFDLTTDYNYPTYTAGVDWRPLDALLVYAKTSRGARSGGQNFRGASANTLTPFNPEFVQDVEVGMKGDFLDRRLRTNVAAYRTAYQAFQFSEVVGISTVIKNEGNATIYGTELESTYVPTDKLSFIANGSFIDFRYDNPGLTAVVTPRFQLSPAVSYKQPVPFGELGATLGYSWKSHQALDIHKALATSNPTASQGSYGLLQASAYASWDRHGLRVGVFGTNLTNQDYKVQLLPLSINSNQAIGGVINPGTPRLFGVEVVQNFDFGS